MAETTTITKPAPILEGSLTAFLKSIDKLGGGAIPASRMQTITKPDGTTEQVFKGIDTSLFKPTVEGQTQLQKDVVDRAAGLTSLLGTGLDASGQVGPPTAGSIASYMSPYQQEVIDATLSEFDRQRGIAQTAERDRAIQAGAYGGGREGVLAAEAARAATDQRTQLQAQLLNQAFQQAQAARAADLQAEMGLGQYQSALGQQQQAVAQAQRDADQIAAREQQFAPFTQLGLVGQQLAQIQPGAFPTQTVGIGATAPTPSPMTQFLTGAAGIGGIAGKVGLFG